jgi:transcriptional regulator with XRE-family HTH domain
MKTYTQDQVVAILRGAQGDKRPSHFAKEIGISAPYFSDILKGNRPPSEQVLTFLGLKRIKTVQITYVEAKSNGHNKL